MNPPARGGTVGGHHPLLSSGDTRSTNQGALTASTHNLPPACVCCSHPGLHRLAFALILTHAYGMCRQFGGGLERSRVCGLAVAARMDGTRFWCRRRSFCGPGPIRSMLLRRWCSRSRCPCPPPTPRYGRPGMVAPCLHEQAASFEPDQLLYRMMCVCAYTFDVVCHIF